MNKHQLPGSTALFPVPAVMLSCGAEGYKPNIITLAWVGTLNSHPPIVGVSIRPERHSYGIVHQSKEFVVNIATEAQLPELDYCGVVSGKDADKFTALGLTPQMGSLQHAPLIAECPVNLECKVIQEIVLGSHTLFLGEVVQVQVSEEYLNEQGRPDVEKIKPFVYCGPQYHGLGHRLGLYGKVRK